LVDKTECGGFGNREPCLPFPSGHLILHRTRASSIMLVAVSIVSTSFKISMPLEAKGRRSECIKGVFIRRQWNSLPDLRSGEAFIFRSHRSLLASPVSKRSRLQDKLLYRAAKDGAVKLSETVFGPLHCITHVDQRLMSPAW
jgi:hypothetical protein